MTRSLLAALTCCLPAAALAQDTVSHQLPAVVTITRDVQRSPFDLPFAISLTHPDSLLPGQSHLFIEQTLAEQPGITVANRTNPSQDTRISIRGFGARSQFGVRSIRILRDGMPLTNPDGQTPIDYLDLENVGSVETIRGTAAALYGNASGGVIDLRSAPPPAAAATLQLRSWLGSYDLHRTAALFGGTLGDGGDAPFYQGNVGRTKSTGYRQYSGQDLTNGFVRTGAHVGGTDVTLVGMGLYEPLADNPGAVTIGAFDANPDTADALSISKHARKVVHQVQAGVSARRPLGGGGELAAEAYDGTRSLYNPLTFSVVRVDRHQSGGSLRATLPVETGSLTNHLSAGVDLQGVNDARKNWTNCWAASAATIKSGACSAAATSVSQEEGSLTLEQREIVSSIGPYVRDEISLGRAGLTGGLRYDDIRFEVQDHLGPNSGVRTMNALSPVGGVNLRLAPLHSVYATVSTAFETPTTTELGNQPSGATGFNPTLQPQLSTTYETGAKGWMQARLAYDVALFDTEVRDELIPYETPGSAGKTFYMNAGRTRREGAELSLSTTAGPVDLSTAYTLSHFRFRALLDSTGKQQAGNAIPGIPDQQLQAAATWRLRRLFLSVDGLAKSDVFVNDANQAAAPGFVIFNARVGGTAAFGRPWLSPVLGVTNLLDRHYIASVAINAAPPAGTAAANAVAATKFYEPAAGRTLFVGLSAATSPW